LRKIPYEPPKEAWDAWESPAMENKRVKYSFFLCLWNCFTKTYPVPGLMKKPGEAIGKYRQDLKPIGAFV
jgi:hypothetical protein